MHLSKTAAFYLQASLIVSFLAGSSAPTPLYAVYQAAWGFSPVTVTLVFGIYALAVLAALLTLGSLSDYVGRRPVLLVAVVLQAIAMLIFAHAGSVPTLLAARIVQGLATGGAVAAIGAGMLDIDRERGTIANAIGPMSGTALGGIISGLLVQYLPAPTQLVYFALFAVFVAQAIALAFMPETSPTKSGALRSLVPHFSLPAEVRAPLLAAIPALVASWSLAGFYGSLGPTLMRTLAGHNSVALGGLVLFVLAGSGALAVLYAHARPARSVMAFGNAALMAGVAITLLGVADRSLALFFVGAPIAGVGFGTAFQGAIRSVISLVGARDRAGVLSILYVVAYLAMGLPAVLGGVSVAYAGLLPTTHGYGLGVIALAAAALLATIAPPSLGRVRAHEPVSNRLG